ncbi:MAG: leucine-rich repeat protein [Clostridia bacterium]
MKRVGKLLGFFIIIGICIGIFAACSNIEFEISFIVDGEIYHTINTSGNEIVKMPNDPSKDGYIFDGWFWDKDIWERPFTANSLLGISLSENIQIYAKGGIPNEEIKTHTVIFDGNGGTFVSGEVTQTVEHGKAADAPIFTKPELTLSWDKAFDNIVGDITVKAEWSAKVEFVTNGGTDVESLLLGQGSRIAIPECSREGYTLDGWYTSLTNGETLDEKWSFNSSTIQNNIKLYAKWLSPFTFTRSGNNYIITGLTELGATKTSLEIPAEIEGNSVIDIAPYAFKDYNRITSIVIPYGLRTIGNNAFEGCTGLSSMSIPNSVTNIGGSAFSGCSGLVDITLPFVGSALNNPSNIHFGYIFGASSYNDNSSYIPSSLKTVVITQATSIGNYAFSGCSSLTSIVILDSITNIEHFAFSGCSGLTSITIPESVINIGYSAFSGCNNLMDITLPFVGETLNGTGYTHFGYIFGASSYSENSVYIPYSLKTVTITGGSSIDSYSFYNCNNLTSVTIPDSIINMGNYVFYDCSSLTSVTIGGSVTSIGSFAFSGCGSLTSVTIPESVISIGDSAFYNCSSLTSIIIGDSVTSIGSYAFRSCSSLMSITIPDSVLNIEHYAFYNCNDLTSVTIPNSVTSIGTNAFKGCDSLNYINISNANVKYKSVEGVLFSKDAKTLIRYPIGKELTSYTIPDSVTSIEDYAFSGCNNLTSITIPINITSIGDWVFFGCSSLTSITIGGSVTSIGKYAFYDCNGLVDIVLPFVGNTLNGTSNTHFGYIFGANSYIDNSDYIPSSLKTVTITGGHSIGSHTFFNCNNLTSITIPTSITSIGNYAFRGCSSLTSVIIGGNVTSIGSYAFYDCNSLTIYARAASKPSGWDSNWNYSDRPVVWDYKD